MIEDALLNPFGVDPIGELPHTAAPVARPFSVAQDSPARSVAADPLTDPAAKRLRFVLQSGLRERVARVGALALTVGR